MKTLSRVIAVAKRIAGHVIQPMDAARVRQWMERVAEADALNVDSSA